MIFDKQNDHMQISISEGILEQIPHEEGGLTACYLALVYNKTTKITPLIKRSQTLLYFGTTVQFNNKF